MCRWEGCVFVCVHMCTAVYLGVGRWLWDILALHLAQVVLSPQSPLETPKDRERSIIVLLHRDNFSHTQKSKYVKSCLILQV